MKRSVWLANENAEKQLPGIGTLFVASFLTITSI